MAWPSYLYRPTDLEAVCRHFPATVSEYHPQNTLYGHHLVLKDYAGLPRDEPLPWVIEHAISFGKEEPYFAHAGSCLPLILSINEAQAGVLRGRTRAEVEPIGSCFFYLRELFRRRHPGLLEAGSERRGTLVFPTKSTRHAERDFDRLRFARQLAELPEAYQPVSVCLFWRDYERGGHREFEEAGLTVVSAGHQEDPDFLYRYLDLCRQFEFACANHISTSFCYSVLAGCRFFYWPTGGVVETRDGRRLHHDSDPTLAHPAKRRCAEASPFPPPPDGGPQRALAAHFAGEAHVRPAAFFRERFDSGRRLLRGIVPASIVLQPVERFDRLAEWLPRNVDNDGWAQERSGFSLPHREGFAGVRVTIEVPARADARWEAEWTLLGARPEPCFFRVWAGEGTLDIPTPPPGGPASLEILSTDPVTLAGEGRQRCFRIRAIEWIETPPSPAWAWAYRKDPEGRALAEWMPESLSLADHGPAMPDRSGWLLAGVGPRGSATGPCAFIVPRHPRMAGVRVKISLGPEGDPSGGVAIRVRLDEGRSGEAVTPVGPGSWYLEVPAQGDGPGIRVEIRAETPGGDPASTGFRIRRLEWRKRLGTAAPGGSTDPVLQRLDGGRAAAAANPPPVPNRPLWRRFWERIRSRGRG